jgi:N-acetylglutamate synthase-like GNAT family acetyltransferase
MIRVVNAKEYSGGVKKCSEYIHSKWGNKDNYLFYHDLVLHSFESGKKIPQFYVLLKNEDIIGCYCLITNDLVSRQDLFPWFACLFIEEKERGNEYGKMLLEHGYSQALKAGFSKIYLTTSHDGYYEKYGWERMADGYYSDGIRIRIYIREK